jgi:C4-dicarboxylate transporter DctM subunit
MSSIAVGAIGLGIVFLIMFLRVPIGVAMALVGTIGFSYLVSVEAAFYMAGAEVYNYFFSYSLTPVAVFILMGQIVFRSGVGERLYRALYSWIGHLSGGLSMATLVACAGFGAICGSPTASVATMATVCLPEMKKYNYATSLAVGSVTAGGTLGILIPPSVTFIVYGILVEESIGKLFMGGILPGLLLTGLFIVTVVFLTRRNPLLGPPGARSAWKKRLVSLAGVWEVLVLFVFVMGGLFAGLFTPTEAGAIGAFGALILGLVQRRFPRREFIASVFETLRTTSMVFVILVGTSIFGRFLAVTKIPFELAVWVGELHVPPTVIFIVIVFVYLIAGCAIEALPLIMLTIPIFFPLIVALGYDPIWFGVIIVLVSQMGLITPPVGVSAYVVAGVTRDVPLGTIFRGALMFLPAIIMCIIILMIFPKIALFLPNLM